MPVEEAAVVIWKGRKAPKMMNDFFQREGQVVGSADAKTTRIIVVVHVIQYYHYSPSIMGEKKITPRDGRELQRVQIFYPYRSLPHYQHYRIISTVSITIYNL